MQKEDLEKRKIAYFSMEVGLSPNIPTYSGGLGILAGDTLKSCADLGVPLIGVTLLNEKGYFKQKLAADGGQSELPVQWQKEEFLTLLSEKVKVNIEEREVVVRAWEYIMMGVNGFTVPVYFLDTNLEENGEYDRALTSFLYGGDQWYRLCQEIILGIGGVRIIEALGYRNIEKYHMNEGHASLLAVELLEKTKKEGESDISKKYSFDQVKDKCIFTTHTPVAAGHDRFPVDFLSRALKSSLPLEMPSVFIHDNQINMTRIALKMSKYVNGVAKKHREVTSEMFPGYYIGSITNGVHLLSWVAPAFKELYDKYIPGWPSDYFSLRYALNIPKHEISLAHRKAKEELVNYVNKHSDTDMRLDTFTIGFARRATPYKRGDLLFSDTKRLRQINSRAGKIQLIYAGKAHPKDLGGKDLIKRIFSKIKELSPEIKIAYLENYDMDQGKLITSGVDLWLNNPLPPQEASGTSGMKACLNGVPNLSVLDGWWIEGCIEGITGWAIGSIESNNADTNRDAEDMYEKLERMIIPMFYRNQERWIEIMRHAVALNASFFNTQRMVQEYALNAYL